MMNPLAHYERMDALSGAMVRAAQAQDWDRLADLEHEVAALRDALALRDVPPDSLSALERTRKVALIHRILDNDAEVRRHTEPWMEHVRRLLAGAHATRSVARAYGATAGC